MFALILAVIAAGLGAVAAWREDDQLLALAVAFLAASFAVSIA